MKIGDSIEKAWNTFNKMPQPFILAAIVMIVVWGVLGWLSRHFWGVSIVSSVVTALLGGGFTLMAVRAHRGAPVDLPQLFGALERPVPYLVVYIAISAGLLLCGIGILVTSFLFCYATVYVARGDDFGAALGKSKDMALSRPVETSLVLLVIAGMMLAGAVLCGIGLVIAIPMSFLFIVEALDQLEGQASFVSEPT